MKLTNFKIILGITGGIAAYKAAYLCRLLVKSGAEVQVIMTEAATRFVTPLTFEALTNRDVAVEMFPDDKFVGTRHIDFAKWPDLFVVAPATADFIAQITHGHCSSLLAAVICATKKKIMLAPAMNDGMYTSFAVQKNIAALKEAGFLFSDVGVGEMACDSFGPGRMAEPDEIFESVIDLLCGKGPLSDKKVLVTAGPAQEAIDPVRFISNRSSGKMGFALARQAQKLGAEVTLVSGPVAIPDPTGIELVKIISTQEMYDAVQSRFTESDYLIMAAAPADYKPAMILDQKIKKCDKGLWIDLKPTIDILKKLSSSRTDSQVMVGFSLETENEIENSQKKLVDKKLDYIVVNNPTREGEGFETDTNAVTILSRDGKSIHLEKNSKDIIAIKIWEYILSHGL